jgi:DNA-binding transcriptional LysR family regulator
MLHKETDLSYTVAYGATMNVDYNLLKVFIKVAELGSFTKAADMLNQPKSRVSRAIARLENELDVQLIRRTTRKTSLTSSGQDFFKKIYPILNNINNELISISDQQQEMSGCIRITASQDMGQTLIAPLISKFNEKYPNVSFETIITNEFLDLTKENIDIAFRAGKLKDSTLIQRKFLAATFILVCSKEYIEKYNLPKSIEDLENHKFLSFNGFEKKLSTKTLNIKPLITSDSLSMILKMTLDSSGVAILPDFLCKEYLEDNSLVRIIPTWKSKSSNINILYPPSRNISHKVKIFLEMAMKY